MSSRHAARAWAVQLLFEQDFNPRDRDAAFAEFWTECHASAKARAFCEDLVRGVLAERARIDRLIQACADNWRLERMAGVDRNILRLATYEMLCRDDVPPAVAINEAVELAKDLGDSGSGRFVNGILDRIRKEIGRPASDAR
jgi:N utilization substance protein B